MGGMGGGIAEFITTATTWILPVLFAVTLHEAAHGWVAWKLGDDTAKRMGRVTFNPVRHIDGFGTILLPALLLIVSGGRIMIGYAKPVPVQFHRLYQPRRDMVFVAAAGPGTNILLAFVSALLFHVIGVLPGSAQEWLMLNLQHSIWINALLACFNMLPIPPLDGGRVAVGLLPRRLGEPLARLEQAGIFIVLGVIFLLPMLGRTIGLDLNVFMWLVGQPAMYISQLMLSLAGVV